MDPLLLILPLLLAIAVSQLGLPPLIGYLAAGFALFGLGIDALEFLTPIADLGILLLLFAIGLKLDLTSLLNKEVWRTASVHMIGTVLVAFVLLKLFALANLSLFAELTDQQILTIGFALSFSSTVFAIKVLEENGDLQSLFGRTAIGILIMQDIFAVLYLTISKGQWPSVWAFGLIGLVAIRPLLFKLMQRCGHGEMLVLFGLAMALGPGAALFAALGLKPDLGALIMGILLAGNSKSSELSKSLFLFKELFLVAFFMSIGQQGIPTFDEITAALLLLLLLPLKFIAFKALLLLSNLRLRTSFMSSLTLNNFSEFGLIVMTAAIAAGGLDASWLRVMALAVTFSFLIAAPLNQFALPLYQRLHSKFDRFQRSSLHPDDQPIHIGHPKVVIFGMGRIGSAAYDVLEEAHPGQILGIDHKQELVDDHIKNGRNAVLGDGIDADFWEKLVPSDGVELVVLAMPSHHGNSHTAELLFQSRYSGKVSAIVRYSDEEQQLMDIGVHNVYNIYQAAGTGLADQVMETLPLSLKSRPSL